MIGRDQELAELVRRMERIAGGRGEASIVRGLAGVGKTALVDRAFDLAAPFGVAGLTGRAVPDPAVPYRMLTEIALAALAEGADVDKADMLLYRPALLSAFGDESSSATTTGDGPAHPLLVAEALVRLATQLTAPTVLVLEDLHWTDPEGLAAFEYLCDHAPDRGLGVVATVRSDEPSDALGLVDRLVARRAVSVVDLPPLDDVAVEKMIELCLGQSPSAELAVTVATRSEGRPLVVEELLTMMSSGAAGSKSGTGVVPASLLDSVSARLAGLERPHRAIVVLAAVLGLDVDLAVLGHLVGVDTSVATAAFTAAEHAFLGTIDGSRFRFHHGLTREAVLGATPAAELRLMARNGLDVLGALDEFDDRQLEAAAALATHAGEAERAARLHLEAGRRALNRGAIRSAEISLRHAQQGATFDYELRAEASAALVESLSQGGNALEAVREGTAALRMARSRADTASQHRIQLALVRADIAAERWQQALTRLGELAGDIGRRPDVLALRALAELGAGRLDQAESVAKTVIDIADEVGDAPAVCEALEVLGRIARTSDLEAAAQWFERGVRVSERAGLRYWRARALHEQATIQQLDAGQVGLHDAALEAALDAGAFGVAAAVLFHLGALHGVQFESERGLEEGRRCLDLTRRLGTPRQAAMSWIVIGQAHASAGREPQARAAAGEAKKLVSNDPEIEALAGGACIALALLFNERRKEAVDELAAAVALLEDSRTKTPTSLWYLWPVLAAVERRNAQRALAVTDVTDLRILRGFDALWLLGAAVETGRRGQGEEAVSLLERSLAQFDRCPGFIGYRHLGLRIAADAVLEDGWVDPGPWLIEAGAWFEARDLVPVARACRSLAARAGVPIRRRRGGAVPAGLADLGVTSREVDVLSVLSEGLTNRQIGDRLYISHRTVKTHVEHLLSKTGAANRAQLATMAARYLSEADIGAENDAL